MPKRETWDLIIKGGSAVAAIGTLMVSAAVYLGQREDAQRDFQRETQRPFLDQQFKLYSEAVSVVARLNSAHDKGTLGEGSDDLDRFWQLYWGPLAVVEDSRVEAAMVYVGRSLTAIAEKDEGTCAKSLKLASLNLAHSVRRSMEQHWGVALDTDQALPKRIEDSTKKLRQAC